MENQINDQQDEELEEATKGLEPQDGSVEEEKFEDIGEIKPEEPQVPEVDFKPLPKGLKYEFLGPDKTYPQGPLIDRVFLKIFQLKCTE
jgi:hypothetical protein